MTASLWQTSQRGLLAPIMAIAAIPFALFFALTSSDESAWIVLAWQLGTLGLLLLALRTPRLCDRPGAAAGLFGVIGWLVLLPTMSEAAGSGAIFAWLASAFAIGAGAAALAERADAMRDTGRPSALVPVLALSSAAAAATFALAVGSGALEASEAGSGRRTETLERLGTIEIPALPTTLRERFSRRSHRESIEVEVSSTHEPGGGATARVAILREDTDGVLAPRTEIPCGVEVPPLGRTIEVLASDTTYEIRWPISPHGESFGGCVYDRTTLARADGLAPGGAPRRQVSALVVAPLFALLVLALAWPLRRLHARIARSPEARVSTPGIATMPDGSPAVVPADIPMGAAIVALRIADLRPDYRSDARVTVEELLVGDKPTLLVDAARRVRTLELFALAGTLFLMSGVLAMWMLGASLTL